MRTVPSIDPIAKSWSLLPLLVFVGCLHGCSITKPAPANGPNPPVVLKGPVEFAQRTFDPAAPPAEMPPLGEGEAAECDSNFISDANVIGQVLRTGAGEGILTVTQVKVMLGLKITIWVPAGVTQQIIDHEEGHRQISEHYYQNAEQLAAQAASGYAGKRISVHGPSLEAAVQKQLQELGQEITSEYSRKLNADAAQRHYDEVTDHSRSEIAVPEAIAQSLKFAEEQPR
jgi:hypothetical protein